MVGSIINLAVWKEGFLLGKNWTRIYIKKERYIKESFKLQATKFIFVFEEAW